MCFLFCDHFCRIVHNDNIYNKDCIFGKYLNGCILYIKWKSQDL